MLLHLAALLAAVLYPFGVLLHICPPWMRQMVALKHSQMTGFDRTRKLRESLGIRDGQANGARKARSDYAIERVPFFRLSDDEMVKMFGAAFDPEMRRLMKAEPTAEMGSDVTPGNLGPGHDLSPSRLLYGRDYPEINRSIVGLLALKWVVMRDYDAFSKLQRRDRIDRKGFAELRRLVLSYLTDSEELYAVIVATIANDLGKDPRMLQEIHAERPEDASPPNHDEVMFMAAEQGRIDIIEEFPPENPVRSALLLGLKFGSELNVPQFIQAENVPGSLRAVRCFKNHLGARRIKFLEILFDVAGAAGHSDSRGSLTLSRHVWKSYQAAGEILKDILHEQLTYRQGYDRFLAMRGRILFADGFRALRVEDPVDRALLRLMTMGRVTDLATAKLFDHAFYNLRDDRRADLVAGLLVNGVGDGTAVIPYYAPAIFANTLRAFSERGDKAKAAALGALFRFLVRVFAGTHPKPGMGRDLIVECTMDFVQDVVKGKAFVEDPTVLDAVKVPDNAYSVPKARWL